MKKLITILAIAGLVSFGFADDWTFDQILVDFSDTLSAPVAGHFTPGYPPNGPHGVVVAPDGNIWISIHSGYGETFYANGDTLHYKPIYVIDPATGDHVSFSPITHLSFPDGSTDTLYAESVDNGSGKGISLDNDGNILATCWTSLYRINYLTGEGMNKFTPSDMSSCTEAVQDENGYIYYGYVLSAARPVMILDTDFNFLANAIDTLGHINRSLAITPSGNDLYVGSTWSGFGIEHWHSDLPGVIPFTVVDTFGVFEDVPVVYDSINSAVGDSAWVVADPPSAATDTMNTAIWASCLDFDNSGILWAGALTAEWGGPMGGKYYGFDPVSYELLDEAGLQHGDYALGGTDGPRGADWSPDGHTLYLSDFYSNTIGVWTNPNPVVLEIDDESDNPIVAEGFRLAQNYPNPFNPTTTIEYSLPQHGNVNLSIYNVKGELVKTLYNGWNHRGTHEATWNGTNNAGESVSTGVYIYTLSSPTVKFSKRMTFIK